MNREDYDRMSPEFALKAALATVPVIADPAEGEPKVSALQPKKDWKPPFTFYVPTEDSEEEALDGLTGLQSFAAAIHCVAGTYRGLQLLCVRVKKALKEMRQRGFKRRLPHLGRISRQMEKQAEKPLKL